MRAIPKDDIRFALAAAGGPPVQLEVRVRQDRFGGWEAHALLHEQGAPAPTALGRVFRARDRRLAAGKMVAWVRRRYPQSQPLAGRACAPTRDAGGA